jgi:uncharacterized cupredoxin-like copper-binding protein
MTDVVEIDAVATITIDDKGAIDVSPEPIKTIPGKHVVFVVMNNHKDDHVVGISAFDFKPDDPSNPKHPMELLGIHSVQVESGDIGAFTMRVRGKGHFGLLKLGKKFSCKYTINASDLDDKDPQIEINN